MTTRYNGNMISSIIDQIITTGYGRMVTERLEEGWQGYLLTFMFNRLRGPRESVIRQMLSEAERVYATVLTRIIRDPQKRAIAEFPLWTVCPDFPVSKRVKPDLREVRLNDGLHLHGIAVVPPWNRMNCGLHDHFDMSQELYVRRGLPLSRVHAVPITESPEDVVGYGLKAISKRRLDFDHVLILPRAHSEMPTHPGEKQFALSDKISGGLPRS